MILIPSLSSVSLLLSVLLTYNQTQEYINVHMTMYKHIYSGASPMLSSKESSCHGRSRRRHRLGPWLRKSPQGRKRARHDLETDLHHRHRHSGVILVWPELQWFSSAALAGVYYDHAYGSLGCSAGRRDGTSKSLHGMTQAVLFEPWNIFVASLIFSSHYCTEECLSERFIFIIYAVYKVGNFGLGKACLVLS